MLPFPSLLNMWFGGAHKPPNNTMFSHVLTKAPKGWLKIQPASY